MVDWFKQALDQRFDEIAGASEKQHDIHTVRIKLSDITDDLKKQLEPEVFLKILEWEETINHKQTKEKEWMYSEGMKDGMRLIHSIGCFVGGSQSKL
ncbi:hypothetical protein J2T13_004607 [Paenibacillus sp. DS2015]|uniref:hypothetical protein n=1 Tax=Paenibacillus sp. DS2015 TaxID=3373917 RepID=UPI003D20D84A